MRKLVVWVALISMFVMGTSAYGGLFDFFKKDKNKGNEEVVLKLWIMPNSGEAQSDMEEILIPFEQETGYRVEVTVLDWGIAWSKLTTAATSGVGPDLVQLGSTWIPTFASMDALAPLNEYLDGDEEDKFLPIPWTYAKLHGQEDVISLPWVADIRPFYYRKDVFAKAGVDPEVAFANWDNFKEAMRRVNNTEIDGKKVAAFGHPGKNDWNVIQNMATFIWSNGGAYLSEDGNTPMVADTQAFEGVKYYASFAKEGLVPKYYLEKNSSDVESLFANGDVAVVQAGPWFVKSIEDAINGVHNDGSDEEEVNYLTKVGIAPPLRGPNGTYTFSGSSNLAIFEFSENKDEAAELLKFLTLDKDAQIAYAIKTSLFPPLKEAAESDYIVANPYRSKLSDYMEYGRAFPVVPAWGPIETVLLKNIGQAWDVVGEVDGAYTDERLLSVLENAEKEMQMIIDQAQ